jgi:hypothetical protein
VTPTTLPGFPAGVTAGTYGPVVVDLDLSTSFTSAFVTASGGTLAGAAAALIAGMNSTDRAYFNIHTSAFPGGEIRGFLAPIPVPAAVWLLASALGVLAWARGRITS